MNLDELDKFLFFVISNSSNFRNFMNLLLKKSSWERFIKTNKEIGKRKKKH